jgi:hypothetical protein
MGKGAPVWTAWTAWTTTSAWMARIAGRAGIKTHRATHKTGETSSQATSPRRRAIHEIFRRFSQGASCVARRPQPRSGHPFRPSRLKTPPRRALCPCSRVPAIHPARPASALAVPPPAPRRPALMGSARLPRLAVGMARSRQVRKNRAPHPPCRVAPTSWRRRRRWWSRRLLGHRRQHPRLHPHRLQVGRA